VRPCTFPLCLLYVDMCCGHSEPKNPRKSPRKASESSETGYRTSKAKLDAWLQTRQTHVNDWIEPLDDGAANPKQIRRWKRMRPGQ